MLRFKVAGLVLLVVAAAGCPNRDVAQVPSTPSVEVEVKFQEVGRDVDILFVVDRSISMADEQDALAANFPVLITELETIDGGLPSLHLAVTTSDIGVGGYPGWGGCVGTGDGGRFFNSEAGTGTPCLTSATDFFLEDVELMGGARQQNYGGTLGDAFSCMSLVGTGGCGFEQPLEAMRLALGGDVPENDGFRRPGALLAVVLVTDEDDCSAADPALFDQGFDGLGPGDFRCFADSATCELPITPTAGLELGECQESAAPQFLAPTNSYVDFLSDIAGARVLVAGIHGVPEGSVGTVAAGQGVNVRPVCGDDPATPAVEGAEPGIRVSSFLRSFPTRHVESSLCGNDFGAAMRKIGEFIADNFNRCLPGELLFANGEPICQVEEEFAGDDIRQLIPPCSLVTTTPCWRAVQNPMLCSGSNTPTQLRLEVDRGGAAPDPDATLEVRCAQP